MQQEKLGTACRSSGSSLQPLTAGTWQVLPLGVCDAEGLPQALPVNMRSPQKRKSSSRPQQPLTAGTW